MKNNYSVDPQFLVDNLQIRTQLANRKLDVNIGVGNPNAGIIVVQSDSYFEPKGPVLGALKKFSLENESFRTSCAIISGGSDADNCYILRELIEMMSPYLVVTCGIKATSMLKGRRIRNFDRHHGKSFDSSVVDYPCYATIDPNDYGCSDANRKVKKLGREQWSSILELYKTHRKNSTVDWTKS
jgi:hypothetical protein